MPSKLKLQPAIDDLLLLVEATGRLNKDEHVTGNVFELIENNNALRQVYNDIRQPYAKPDAVNNMIGKRIRQRWKNKTGKVVNATPKTTLAKTYKLLQ